MINTKSLKKLTLIGSLYVSQFIPAFFIYQALPVFMRQKGVSLQLIGLLPLVVIPVMLKFLWSPLIDRYGFTRWGHYKFWIICFQFLVICTVISLAFLGINQNFVILLLGMLLLSFLCSSQDIATDALAVGLLEPQERGLGNGIQTSGNYTGAVIGGGGMLILLSRWGWRATLLTMALIMLIALIPIIRHRERINKPPTSSKNAPGLKNLITFYRRPGMGKWLLMLVFYSSGTMMATTMFRPLLVDIGLSLAEIGLLLGIVSYSAGILGAILAGLLIVPLGRKKSLILFGLIRTLAICTYLLPAFGITNLSVLYFVAICVQISIGMATTPLYTVMMDKSNIDTAGTDYTMQNSIVYFGGIFAAATSGILAKTIGYPGVFAISIMISIIGLFLIVKTYKETNYPQIEVKNCD
ncbi:MAG: MFS transporter [Cyanobacteria bacterium J06573_2]